MHKKATFLLRHEKELTQQEVDTGLSEKEIEKRKDEFIAELKADIEKHTGFTHIALEITDKKLSSYI